MLTSYFGELLLFFARPLRLEFPGALYHITARGNAREPIVADEDLERQPESPAGGTVMHYAEQQIGQRITSSIVGVAVLLSAGCSTLVVNTVAGSGPSFPDPGNFSGDGGAATAARLDGPWGLAVARDGSLYISDLRNHRKGGAARCGKAVTNRARSNQRPIS